MKKKHLTVYYKVTCIKHRDRDTRKFNGKVWEKLSYHMSFKQKLYY